MSWMQVLTLALLATPVGLVAQSGSDVTRLSGRVPAAALPAIDSIIAAAVAESLPTEPLVQKALEGSAKNIPADRLVNGVRRGLLQLRQARAVLTQAMPVESPPVGHIAAVASALGPALSSPTLDQVITVDPP